MKKEISITQKEIRVRLSTDIVYGHRRYWGKSIHRSLGLSLLYPDGHFGRGWANLNPELVDKLPDPSPVVVWLCGGAFTEMDKDIWLPELTFLAKKGYIVASVEYSVTPATKFPEQMEDVKLAIRFLKAHAKEFNIDPERIAVMGESAGAFLSIFCAITGKLKEYDKGGYEEYSSEVKAAVPWYGGIKKREGTVDLIPLINKDTPPFLILHGKQDPSVPIEGSESLYNALQKAGVYADFYIVENAKHGDVLFCQDKIREIILKFLDEKLM